MPESDLLRPSNELALASARQADDFVDSIGVNTHLRYSDTAYDDFASVEEQLAASGIRHIRDGLELDLPSVYRRYQRLAELGVKVTLGLGNPLHGGEGSPWGTVGELSDLLENELLPSGVVEAVEGANEWDLTERADWAAEARAHQRNIWTTVKGNPALSHLPVLTPSLGRPTDSERFAELGDLSDYADFGNVHDYPGGVTPTEEFVAGVIARQSVVSSDKPIIATETGYHQSPAATDQPDGNPAVTQAEAGDLIPRIFLEHFAAGIERTFVYELVDQYDRPNETESNFGQLNHDFSPKQSFRVMSYLIALLADPGPLFKPEPLGFNIEADGDEVASLLLQSRDRDWYLIVWRRSPPVSQTSCENDGTPLTIRFDRRLSTIIAHRPLCDEREHKSGPNGGAVLQVADDVVVLQLGE